MHQWHYNKSMLVEALRQVGVMPGDVIFSHISLGRLGYPEEGANIETACNVLLAAFKEILDENGTLLIPTYTYSIGKREIYDVQETPSTVGPFTDYFRKLPGVIRSRDPMLAVSGMGPMAEELLTDLPRTCYGEDSLYDRMRKVGAKICNIGISLYWATFRHHIEEMAGVPFRFRKMFYGYVRDAGQLSHESWVYFAAPLIDNCTPDGMRLDKMARNKGICNVIKIGRSEIICIGAQEYFELGMKTLKEDPWFAAKGPPCDTAELIRLENERVGRCEHKVELMNNSSMKETIETLWYLPRDHVSDGYDAALTSLASQIPITIHEYKTGTKTWSGLVPEKWTCYEACVETELGRQIFSYSDNYLHVCSYSQPFEGVVKRGTLFEHLYTHAILLDAIPFHALNDKREWGLCCSQAMKDSMDDEFYRVAIRTAFSFSSLKVGEVVAKGRNRDTILLCSHLDHPAQVNDGLTGVAVGMSVIQQLMQQNESHYTYRLLIIPEKIGLEVYLFHNQNLIPSIKGIFHIDMLGLNQNHRLELKNINNNILGRFATAVVEKNGIVLRNSSFGYERINGQDSTFFFPDISVPILLLSRSEPIIGNETFLFNEHHSHFDSLQLLNMDKLEESAEVIISIINKMEQQEKIK